MYGGLCPKSTCPRVSHLGHSLFFDYCGLDFGCCAESVVEDDCEFISTLHSDLCDQLADDAVFKVLYIRTRCGYLFEESVESAFDIQRGANLGFFDFDDLAEFGDVCIDTLEFALEFLLVTSLCTNPYDSHHIVLLFLELCFKVCDTDVCTCIDEYVAECYLQLVLDLVLILDNA